MFNEKSARTSSGEMDTPTSPGSPNLKASELDTASETGLNRHLSARHLQFIAVGTSRP